MAVLTLFTLAIALKFLSVASDPDIVASCPNMMRIGNEETVLVSLHNSDQPVNLTVTVTLKLFENGDEGVISEDVVYVGREDACAVLYVDPEIMPRVETEEELQRFAYVTVSCPDLEFEETEQVLLSYEEGFLFIQTDKPVYTPDQSVKIRVISLDQYLTPSSQKIQLDIHTPQDVIVRRNTFEGDELRNGILSNTFVFSHDPMFGHWKIVAHYGKDLTVNRTVEFEVKEYVLPTFSVKIQSPAYILSTDDTITIQVRARYVYEKPVRGRCFMKVGIQEDDEEPVVHHTEGTLLHQGEAQIQIDTNILGEDWFEESVGSSLYVEVTVVEDATGHFENASDTSAKFVRSPYTFSWERTMRYFKKGLPFEVKTDLKFMNGEPAAGVHVRVIAAGTIDGQEEKFILRGASRRTEDGAPAELEPTEDDTNDKGQVNFRLFVPRSCNNIRVSLETVMPELIVRGDNPSDNNARLQFDIRPFESPSGREFLVLRVPNKVKPQKLEVEVFLNSVTASPMITYFVVSRGKLMEYGKKAAANIDVFDISVSFEMVPSARIVAYYISDSGHIIADSIWIEVERKCENKLRVRVHDMEGEAIGRLPVKPQTPVSLQVIGTPGTSVALLAVDKAVLLLRDYHRLTPDKMYGSMDEHDTGCGPGGGRNSADVFMNAGLMVLTNLNLDVPRRGGPICAVSAENNRRKRSLDSQRELYANNTAKAFACKRGHKRVGEGTCADKAQRFLALARIRFSEEDQEMLEEVFIACCETADAEANLRFGGVDLTDPRFIDEVPSQVQFRNDFRESWAFDIVDIPEDPFSIEATERQEYSVPGSITTWSLQAFGLHNDMAMCIHKPVDLLVFTNVFIQLNMPYSVIRKEFVEIQATVFNYGNEALAAQMFLEVPDEICSEGTAGELSAEKNFVIGAHDARTITYMLVGLETGEFPIKVAVLTTMSSDGVVKMLRVEPEGVQKTFHHSTILNPTGARLDRHRKELLGVHDLECDGMVNDGTQTNCLDINLPATAIPESASCSVSVTGNGLGPIVTAVISGLGSFIRLPTGCGEQTMLKLAPLVYVLRYLTHTDSGTDDEMARALSHTQSGVAHEQNYRHPDGAYSAFLGRAGSTWLTAFVGKVFCQASEFIYVDTKASCGAIQWLMGVQRGDGAFVERSPILIRSMSGGVQGDAGMTAFVVIAMNECQCFGKVNGLATSSERAVRYLKEQLHTLQSPYEVAIVTYALALVDSDKRFDANDKLKSLAIDNDANGVRFWGTAAARPSALTVETTGYALLAQLALEEISYSHSIVKWLSQQQNYGGSFVSTQDTVVALQALSEYATIDTSPDLDMYCNVTADENFHTVLSMQEGDALVQRTVQLPPKSIKGRLRIKTGGDGVGQLNVEVKYNDLASNNDAECRFNLEVTSERINGQDGTPFVRGNSISVRVCASYRGEEQTSMAIIDVGLYSGFAPVEETLRNLVIGDGLIARTEVSGRSVILYADHIPVEADDPLCFEFDAVCEIVVGNLHHAAVKVYDYYDPDEECTKFYAPQGANLLGTLCSNEGMCSCVSSKCANCTGPRGETVNDLLKIACDTAQTYVFKIEVRSKQSENGFDIVEGMVERVIKRGDDQHIFDNLARKFWVSSSCECPGLKLGRKYMVIGRNYLQYEEEAGLPGFKYIIDHTVAVRPWRRGRRYDYLTEVQDIILSGNSNCG